MPSESKAQRRFMAMVEHTPKSELSGKAKKAKESMTHKQLHDFAATKEKHLPEHVKRRKEHKDKVKKRYSMD